MADGAEVVMRPIEDADFETVHRLNQGAVPNVGTATVDRMRRLIDISEYAMVPTVGGEIAGYILAMTPGAPYESENYRWFSERYDSFVYVDRIVVAPDFRGRGVGRAIYDDVERFTSPRAPVILCEVNTRPMNELSLAFHKALGFEQVGEQETEGGKKSVALLRKTIVVSS